MLPYPEPYQSTYQQRRLGALGIEWRPSSITFAVGTDIGMGQEFQILPLADLDVVLDPLPDYGDAIFWEPENDVINDDNDSDYGEEYFSDEKTSPSGSTSNDSVCSEEDRVKRPKDRMRRSRRKKSLQDVSLISLNIKGHVQRLTLEVLPFFEKKKSPFEITQDSLEVCIFF